MIMQIKDNGSVFSGDWDFVIQKGREATFSQEREEEDDNGISLLDGQNKGLQVVPNGPRVHDATNDGPNLQTDAIVMQNPDELGPRKPDGLTSTK